MKAPCAGKWELFDSTDLADHLEAATLCGDCPMLAACEQTFAELLAYCHPRGRPAGTWAGRLINHNGKAIADNRIRQWKRIADEDATYTDEDARRAHGLFWHGSRDDWTIAGERTYQRRSERRQRAARKARAA